MLVIGTDWVTAHGLLCFTVVDKTQTLDPYVCRAKVRAKQNWQRAQKAAEKQITLNLLKSKREWVDLALLSTHCVHAAELRCTRDAHAIVKLGLLTEKLGLLTEACPTHSKPINNVA